MDAQSLGIGAVAGVVVVKMGLLKKLMGSTVRKRAKKGVKKYALKTYARAKTKYNSVRKLAPKRRTRKTAVNHRRR